MAEVINLRLARKAKHRAEKETAAAENRAKFGEPKATKLNELANARLDAKRLDGHRLNTSDEKP